MSKFIRKTGKKIGAAPGTLVHISNNQCDKIDIYTMQYSPELLIEKDIKLSHYKELSVKDDYTVNWVNINGIHDVKLIDNIGKIFNLHPLVVEDILNTMQRPKIDEFDDYIYAELKMLYFDDFADIKSQQISLVIGDKYVLSFQEFDGKTFDNVRERIRGGKIYIRKAGSDYLAYALIDSVVDSYFEILEKLGDIIDNIEEELMNEPEKHILQKIYHLKREIMFIRNSLWPLREVISILIRGDSPLIKESTTIYLRDVYDHTIQIIDTVEVYQEMLSNMLDTYLSSIGNRTNDTMKILTIFSTIFIPLTFLAGIYGMNFRYMPELSWRIAYPLFWVVSIIITVVMMLYFKRKKWL